MFLISSFYAFEQMNFIFALWIGSGPWASRTAGRTISHVNTCPPEIVTSEISYFPWPHRILCEPVERIRVYHWKWWINIGIKGEGDSRKHFEKFWNSAVVLKRESLKLLTQRPRSLSGLVHRLLEFLFDVVFWIIQRLLSSFRHIFHCQPKWAIFLRREGHALPLRK